MSARQILDLLIFSILLVTLWPLCSDAEDGQLTSFHGGTYRCDVFLSNGLLAGMGSKNSALGGTCTGLDYGVDDLYWNPARLGFLENTQAMLDLSPPFLSLDANSLVDINGQATQAVDDLVVEMGSDDLVLDLDDYPHIDATLGQRGFVPNGALALPLMGWGLGLGLYQVLNLDLNTVGTGLQAMGYGQDEDDTENDVTISASADLSLSMLVQVNAISFGLGKELLPRWSLGLAVDRYYGHSKANGRLQIEGIILRAGQETAFNDSSDPWPNDLYSEMVGSYQGSAWGFKMGTSYRLRPNLSLDGTVTLPTRLHLGGEMNIVQYSVPGIDLEADEPVDTDQVDLDEPTRTQLEENPTADEIIVELPGSLNLGAAWQMRFLTPSLQYIHYFGHYGCAYGIEEMDVPVQYTVGMSPTDALTLGLDFNVVRLSGGFILGKTFYQRDPQKEDQQAEHKKVLLPTFSLGTGFGLGESWDIDLLFISVPAGVMRVTTTCHF